MHMDWLKQAGLALGLGLAMAVGGWAQVNPPVAPNIPAPGTQPTSPYGGNSELFLGGSYQFAKATMANSQTIATTNVAGAQFGFRYHFTDYNGLEVRFAAAQPTQVYGGNVTVTALALETSVAYVWSYPSEGAFRPFFLGGTGVLRYIPQGNNNTQGATTQSKGMFVYGGGVDFRLSNRWSLRFEYRGLVYRVPDFGLIGIAKWNHMPEPDVGLAYHF